MKIPVSKPDITKKEIKYVNQAVRSGWISGGKFVGAFEELFADKHKAKYGVACNSGTNALTLALRALGIGEGDEVIVPEFTMVATAWAVSYTGAKPVFVDCGDDLNINVNKIEDKITSKTKAIIPVHIYGRQADMDRIMEIAHDYNLYVVEDSCEAHGIPIKGDIACFSLYANKIITAGEGGICITNNKRLEEQMRHLRAMAFNPEHTFLHKKIAYNFRMTDLQGAVALAQTERLEEILEKRYWIEKTYRKYLGGIWEVSEVDDRNVLWMYDVVVKNRDGLRFFLEDNGIETRVFFKPMSQQPMYYDENYKNTLAYAYSKLGLYLPTFTSITEKEIKYVSEKIKDFYHYRRGRSRKSIV